MTPESRQRLDHIVDRFAGAGAGCRAAIRELGAGNINATYLVTSGQQSFVLQRINRRVFPDPLIVAENFAVVVRHLQQKQGGQGGECRFADLLPTREAKPWYCDEAGEIWRAQSCLPGRPLAGIGNPAQAGEIGRALGRFHRLIGDLAVESLREPLPGFHILPGYLAEFDRLAGGLKTGGDASQRHCLAAVERYRAMAPLLQQACDQGRLPLRIIHGDPKLDNFLFDAGQCRAVGLIDLDTVGPGLLHYDLGDCLRSCCNRGGEGGDPGRVRFDLSICRAVLSGYLLEMDGSLSRWDRQYLFEAVLLIAYELGLRFLTDHLRGDTYFRVRRQGENLQRAMVQFALVERIAEQEQALRTLL